MHNAIVDVPATTDARSVMIRTAVSYLERALSRNRPHTDEATDRYLLAIALARSGSFEKAEATLNQALREDPENRYRPEAEAALQQIREPSGESL